MTARDFSRPGFLLGGFQREPTSPLERRFIQSGDARLPYTDRKLQRTEDAPLDIATIVKIQQMACDGMKRDDICRALMNRRVTLEDVSRVLDASDESNRPRRQERANVGYAGFKRR